MFSRPITLLALVAFLWYPSKIPVAIPEGAAAAVPQDVRMLGDGALRYIELTGTPYERGLTHGRALKDDIHELLRIWKADMARTTGMEADEFISLFLAGTDYGSAIRAHTPGLLDELRGIAEGSEADYGDLFMFQLIDEYWFNAADLLSQHGDTSLGNDRAADLLSRHGCTSLGVDRTADHPAVTAQNMDIPQFYHGFQMVMKITESGSGHRSLVLTMPGHLGTTGMNDRGVSVNVNTLIQLDYGTTGLPVTYVVRGVAACSTQEEAIALIESVPHASGQNYVIGGPEHPVSLECSAGRVAEYRPFPGGSYTYHTNHPLVNTDWSRRYLARLEQRGRTVEQGLGTCYRFIALQQRFTAAGDDLSIEFVKDVLRSRDHEIDVISNPGTFAGVIYELGERPRLHIAPGRPHETPFLIVEF